MMKFQQFYFFQNKNKIKELEKKKGLSKRVPAAYLIMALSHGRLLDLQIQLVNNGSVITPIVVYVPVSPPVFYARYVVWGITSHFQTFF